MGNLSIAYLFYCVSNIAWYELFNSLWNNFTFLWFVPGFLYFIGIMCVCAGCVLYLLCAMSFLSNSSYTMSLILSIFRFGCLHHLSMVPLQYLPHRKVKYDDKDVYQRFIQFYPLYFSAWCLPSPLGNQWKIRRRSGVESERDIGIERQRERAKGKEKKQEKITLRVPNMFCVEKRIEYIS